MNSLYSLSTFSDTSVRSSSWIQGRVVPREWWFLGIFSWLSLATAANFPIPQGCHLNGRKSNTSKDSNDGFLIRNIIWKIELVNTAS